MVEKNFEGYVIISDFGITDIENIRYRLFFSKPIFDPIFFEKKNIKGIRYSTDRQFQYRLTVFYIKYRNIEYQ